MLICGGAGFLGSHIARGFASCGNRVTIVDGLMPGTGGSLDNLADLRHAVEVRATAVESMDDLPSLVRWADVVVDAMAWTRHLAALRDPLLDMQLNLASHLTLIQALRNHPGCLVIYVGSRSQYGRLPAGAITEDEAVEKSGLTLNELRGRSFVKILAARRTS